jgi:hypothetical protein
MTDLALSAQPRPGYLLNSGFDSLFVLGLPIFALLSALVVIQQPSLFPIVLAMDLWFFGYHHVVATYTRLCFDRESFRQHRFALFYLPPLVLAATLAVGLGIGVWAIVTIYLYWQWFHYARQSWGIAQIYRRKAEHKFTEPEWFSKLAFWAVPVWGILQRSAEQPAAFIGLDLWTFPVPMWAAHAAGIATVLILGAWAFLRLRMWQRGELPVVQTLYVITHFIIFGAAYVFIEDITYGWLAINIWHNLQYLLFVWLFNNQKFRGGIDPRAPLLSRLSQARNVALYFMVTLGITIVVYAGVQAFVADLLVLAIPVILLYQTANFHHYIVDSLIWKARKKPIQKVLALSES